MNACHLYRRPVHLNMVHLNIQMHHNVSQYQQGSYAR
jgi:hypothetical protein